jgi:hypothetical protein
MQKSFYIYTLEMLYKGLNSLNKLNIAKEVKRIIMANNALFINNLYFLKILLNLVKVFTF